MGDDFASADQALEPGERGQDMDGVDAVQQRGHGCVPDDEVNELECRWVRNRAAPVSGVDVGMRFEDQKGAGLGCSGAAEASNQRDRTSR